MLLCFWHRCAPLGFRGCHRRHRRETGGKHSEAPLRTSEKFSCTGASNPWQTCGNKHVVFPQAILLRYNPEAHTPRTLSRPAGEAYRHDRSMPELVKIRDCLWCVARFCRALHAQRHITTFHDSSRTTVRHADSTDHARCPRSSILQLETNKSII